MNLTALTVRVQASRLLTEAEKMYWIQHLPRMDEGQIEKLEYVLSQAEKLRWSAAIPDFNTAKHLISHTA